MFTHFFGQTQNKQTSKTKCCLQFNIVFFFSLTIGPFMDRHFGRKNDLLRERYDTHYINKHKPVFNRVLIYDKWSNYRMVKIQTIGLLYTVNEYCCHLNFMIEIETYFFFFSISQICNFL